MRRPARSKYCGGDVLIRAEAFRQIGGYNPTLIAGEDPELSVRLRQHGWTILRIDAEMTLHDMAMTRFGQWWKRARAIGLRLCRRGRDAWQASRAALGRPRAKHRRSGVSCCPDDLVLAFAWLASRWPPSARAWCRPWPIHSRCFESLATITSLGYPAPRRALQRSLCARSFPQRYRCAALLDQPIPGGVRY